MVMPHELEVGLRHHALITNQDQLQHFPRSALGVVKREYRGRRQERSPTRAIAADEDALQRLSSSTTSTT
ncbi:MAG: hypothetical protein U0744_00025 [Gemmataceae bacterium]